jgi:hypothetical protein
VQRAVELARTYGVRIEFADMGSWDPGTLRSEYDPRGPVIRINTRVMNALAPGDAEEFAAFAVAHELYHHREASGEIARLADRRARESAADEFARSLLAR